MPKLLWYRVLTKDMLLNTDVPELRAAIIHTVYTYSIFIYWDVDVSIFLLYLVLPPFIPLQCHMTWALDPFNMASCAYYLGLIKSAKLKTSLGDLYIYIYITFFLFLILVTINKFFTVLNEHYKKWSPPYKYKRKSSNVMVSVTVVFLTRRFILSFLKKAIARDFLLTKCFICLYKAL